MCQFFIQKYLKKIMFNFFLEKKITIIVHKLGLVSTHFHECLSWERSGTSKKKGFSHYKGKIYVFLKQHFFLHFYPDILVKTKVYAAEKIPENHNKKMASTLNWRQDLFKTGMTFYPDFWSLYKNGKKRAADFPDNF